MVVINRNTMTVALTLNSLAASMAPRITPARDSGSVLSLKDRIAERNFGFIDMYKK